MGYKIYRVTSNPILEVTIAREVHHCHDIVGKGQFADLRMTFRQNFLQQGS
jgi:hypothetical protein